MSLTSQPTACCLRASHWPSLARQWRSVLLRPDPARTRQGYNELRSRALMADQARCLFGRDVCQCWWRLGSLQNKDRVHGFLRTAGKFGHVCSLFGCLVVFPLSCGFLLNHLAPL